MSFLNFKRHPIESGIAFGLILSTGFYVLPPQTSKIASSVFIAIMGGIYWGFAACSGRSKHLVQETVISALYTYIACYILENELNYNPEYIVWALRFMESMICCNITK
eukprot:285436_1